MKNTTTLVLLLFFVTTLWAGDKKKTKTITIGREVWTEFDPATGLVRGMHPDCSEPVLYHPYHVGFDSNEHNSFQSSWVVDITNPRPGEYVNIRMLSGTRNHPYIYKGVDEEGNKVRYKIPAGGTRTIVKNLCPGATVVVFERRIGGGNIPVSFEAKTKVQGSDGVYYTYSGNSGEFRLRINWGFFNGSWQTSEVDRWIITLDQDPIISLPNEFRSQTHYVGEGGVIRPRR